MLTHHLGQAAQMTYTMQDVRLIAKALFALDNHHEQRAHTFRDICAYERIHEKVLFTLVCHQVRHGESLDNLVSA